MLGLQWYYTHYEEYGVEEASSDYYIGEMQGAARVIAYVLNRWGDFKTPTYTYNAKYKALLHKRDAAIPQKLMEDKLPTGYCADYAFYDAYDAFIKLARQHPTTVTLEDFSYCLADAFQKEYDADYEQAHSFRYALEYLCNDKYYTWQGKDITDIVKAYQVATTTD